MNNIAFKYVWLIMIGFMYCSCNNKSSDNKVDHIKNDSVNGRQEKYSIHFIETDGFIRNDTTKFLIKPYDFYGVRIRNGKIFPGPNSEYINAIIENANEIEIVLVNTGMIDSDLDTLWRKKFMTKK